MRKVHEPDVGKKVREHCHKLEEEASEDMIHTWVLAYLHRQVGKKVEVHKVEVEKQRHHSCKEQACCHIDEESLSLHNFLPFLLLRETELPEAWER
nr:unnamed protein product [Digitaria exilis]CAB3491108.1 unnamed protein product [Digitaria exilis]